jgi:hypothetical protein
MPILTFSFDTGTVPLTRIIDAFALAYNYKTTLPDGSANPETKANFARRMVKENIIGIVKSQETKTAIETAQGTINPIVLT